jgi:peptidoglycan/LPS O-acetylase OafA/YrhL
MRRNEFLSLLRMLFVISIVGYHFAPTELRSQIWLFRNGQTLVTFFFVLSGFLTHASSRERPWGAAGFFWKKSVSLGPLYYATLLICIAIEVRNHRFPIPVVVSDLALVQAWLPGMQMGLNPPAWFMSALIFCLGVYPFLCKPLTSRPLRTSLMGIGGYWLVIQVATIFLEIHQLHLTPFYWMYFPPFHLASFLVGMAASEWNARRPSQADGLGASTAVLISSAVLVGSMMILKYAPESLHQAGRTSLFAVPFAWVIYSIYRMPERWVESLNRPLFRWMGQLAFPIYLLQVPVFKVFDRLLLKQGGRDMMAPLFLAYLVLLFVAAALWARVVEPWVLRLFRRRAVAN